MSDAPSRSFTGQMRDAEKVVRARADVSASEFRVFTGIVSGLNEQSGRFMCSDEVMAVICGFRQRQSLSAARAGLKKKGIVGFVPGRPGKLTEYWLALSSQDLDDGLAVLSDRKEEAREKLKRDQPRRLGVKNRLRRKTLEAPPDGFRADDRCKEMTTPNAPPASTDVYAAASRIVYTVHPRHTPSEDSSTDRRIDSERARELVDGLPDDLAENARLHRDVQLALGGGDLEIGRQFAEAIGRHQVERLKERVRDDGIVAAADEITRAAERARRLLQTKQDRGASHGVA